MVRYIYTIAVNSITSVSSVTGAVKGPRLVDTHGVEITVMTSSLTLILICVERNNTSFQSIRVLLHNYTGPYSTAHMASVQGGQKTSIVDSPWTSKGYSWPGKSS